jgi:hypothetical protein
LDFFGRFAFLEIRIMNSSNSLFVKLSNRTIAMDIFNSMLSYKDLSLLICSCKDMKRIVLNWKSIFPIENLLIETFMTDGNLRKMIFFYSCNVIKISMPCKILTLDGYELLSNFKDTLIDLGLYNCIQGGLPVISSKLYNLRNLQILNNSTYSSLQTSEDLISISQLTNMKNLSFRNVDNLDDATFRRCYRTLSNLILIEIVQCKNFTGEGLSSLVEFNIPLESLKLNSNENFCFNKSPLPTSLTLLSVGSDKFSNSDLLRTCENCINIEKICIINCPLITIEGYKLIKKLNYLKELFISVDRNVFAAFKAQFLSKYASKKFLIKIYCPIDLTEESDG